MADNTKSWNVTNGTLRIYLVNNEATDESQSTNDKAADTITLIGETGDEDLANVLRRIKSLKLYRSYGSASGTPCTLINVQKLVGAIWHTFEGGENLLAAADTIKPEVDLGSPAGARDVRIIAVDNALNGDHKFDKVTTVGTIIMLIGEIEPDGAVANIDSITPAAI